VEVEDCIYGSKTAYTHTHTATYYIHYISYQSSEHGPSTGRVLDPHLLAIFPCAGLADNPSFPPRFGSLDMSDFVVCSCITLAFLLCFQRVGARLVGRLPSKSIARLSGPVLDGVHIHRYSSLEVSAWLALGTAGRLLCILRLRRMDHCE
jgi:hypothetical protein